MKKFWTFSNQADSDTAELLIYGEISDTTWWGDEITPRQFAEDLAAQGGKNITVRINSPGGDVFAAHAIHNQLKRYAGRVDVFIDGLAASAATIIMLAGQTITMPLNSMIMIHNPMTVLWGYYESADIRKCADSLDAVRESIINVYLSRSTMTREELVASMDAEKWMTANEAKANGFCDTVQLYDAVNIALNGNFLVVNSVRHNIDNIKNVKQLQGLIRPLDKNSTPTAVPAKNQNTGGKNELEIKNAEDLRAAYPDLVNSIVKETVAAERARLQAIDEIAVTIDTQLVIDAKYGQNPVTAAELALNAIKADAARGLDYAKARAAELENETKNVDGMTDARPADTAVVDTIAAAANAKLNNTRKV